MTILTSSLVILKPNQNMARQDQNTNFYINQTSCGFCSISLNCNELEFATHVSTKHPDLANVSSLQCMKCLQRFIDLRSLLMHLLFTQVTNFQAS